MDSETVCRVKSGRGMTQPNTAFPAGENQFNPGIVTKGIRPSGKNYKRNLFRVTPASLRCFSMGRKT